MKICDKKHEEVVVDVGAYSNCPICEQIKELEKKIEELEEQITNK